MAIVYQGSLKRRVGWCKVVHWPSNKMANSDFHPPVKEISFISRIKSCPSYLMTNRNLLLLKMSFFLIFTGNMGYFHKFSLSFIEFELNKFINICVFVVWITSLPYATLLSKKMVSPEQVAITYSSIPAASILGPIFTGNKTFFLL